MNFRLVCVKMVTLLDGELYLRIFSILFVIVNVNGHVVFIVKNEA